MSDRVELNAGDDLSQTNNTLLLNRIASIVAVVLLAIVSGCGPDLPTSYGSSKGYTARRSVNGFTALRNVFEEAGFYPRDLGRLTDRAQQSRVIVWTPGHPAGIEWKTTQWFERWLRKGDRTLIYVIPDSGSEADFYREARPYAPPEQRLEYRRKHGEALIQEHQWQLARTPLQSNGWFFVRPQVSRTALQAGEPIDSSDSAWDNPKMLQPRRRLEWLVEARDQEDQSQTGSAIWEPAGPNSPAWNALGQSVTETSVDVRFDSLLETEESDTIIARISSDTWKNSQIIVVAGGSLLTNYALTRNENQRLCEQLIASAKKPLLETNRVDAETGLMADGSKPQVSFAKTSFMIPVSELSNSIPRATGLEAMTEFPLSSVTLHLAIMGLIVCLMLIPIFGRPRNVDRGVLTHFGDHLAAVATLMRRRGGEAYAKQRISDYMKQVRGETSGPWVQSSPPKSPTSQVHLHIPEVPAENSPNDSQPTDRG